MAKAEEKRRNCLKCNKSLKRVNWYFRNGGYFCNKRCFNGHQQKAKQD